jgi:pilus assembly protein Flp/PilA
LDTRADLEYCIVVAHLFRRAIYSARRKIAGKTRINGLCGVCIRRASTLDTDCHDGNGRAGNTAGGRRGNLNNTPLTGSREMRKITKKFVEFLKKEDGPTAVEYAVMLALIIVVCIAAITTLGSNANNTFSSVAQKAAPAGGS